MSKKQQSHTLSVLVEDKPGVLQRISGLFTRRNFNIESITVGSSEQKGLSRITITTRGDENVLEQITKQLNKLVETIKIRDLNPQTTIKRELALIKISTPDEKSKSEIIQYIEIFRGHIVDVTDKSLIVEITGDSEKIKALLKLVEPYGIKEITRTGISAISRGSKAL
jgi:acetolactate synthase-1/3 small subunit